METAVLSSNDIKSVSRLSPINPIASIILSFQGRLDGRISLPRKDETGAWLSPKLRNETDSLSAFTAKQWVATESDLSEKHIEFEKIRDESHRITVRLDELKKTIPADPDENMLTVRYPGEEDVDDNVIRIRRTRDWEKKHSEYFSLKNKLETAFTDNHKRFFMLKSQIAERERVTRMICEKAKSHCKQRLDSYWHGAIRTNKEMMPPVPPSLPDMSESEKLYLSNHNYSDI